MNETRPRAHHHQGNGVRIHGIYFLVVSLAALALLITFIAIASTM